MSNGKHRTANQSPRDNQTQSGDAASGSPLCVYKIASELFVKHWQPQGSYTSEHLSGVCLAAAKSFVDAIDKQPE